MQGARIARALCLAAASPACAGQAVASGADGAQDEFVSRQASDADLDAYANGELGVVLPTYPRVYLYPVWRAVVLGRDGLRAAPVRAGGMREAVGSFVQGWVGPEHPWSAWLQASAAYVERPATGQPVFRTTTKGELGQYVNCAPDAFRFATGNLQSLALRVDASPQRLRDWAQAQDTVFEFCDYESNAKPGRGRVVPTVPAALGADAPLFWRQWRDYQIASALFYAGSWDASRAAFARIGSTPSHPLRPWGAYLALRSELRQASTLGQNERDARQAALASLQRNADRILADASLQAVHEMTRATLRAARYRLVPLVRVRELSAALADPAADPTRESALGDWRRLMNDLLDTDSPDKRALDAELRQRHAWFDWIRSVQRCPLAGYEGRDPRQECPAAAAQAQERWRAARGADQRAWLLASMLLAQQLTPALEQAALQVPADAPEYLTIRYHLARLLRTAGQPQRTREIAAAVLAGPQLARADSDSARFLFAQERFATASSREDAAPWLQRTSLWQRDFDSGERRPFADKENATRIAADGRLWLNERLAVADLLALARDPRLAPTVRAGIAASAWLRADLLGQQDNALAAARLAQAQPALRDAATAYLAASDTSARRHALVLASLRLGLSPQLGAWPRWRGQALAILPDPKDDQPVADMWCHLGPPADRAQQDAWAEAEQVPPPPDLATDPAERDREMAALGRVRTATGFVGAHVMARARTQPNDPDLPWLLHVVVMSTRGGCLDADNQALSRNAWQLLHRRFPGNPWTVKTPYYY